MIDRTPNPFGKSGTEPNRRFGRTEPSAKLGFPPKGSASGPKGFGLEAEPVRPSGRNPSQREGVPNSYGLRSFPTICSTLSGLFWLSVRHHSREKDGGGPAPIPHLPSPRLPSSLSPCLDSRPYRPREKTPLMRCVLPLGGASQDPLFESEGRGRLTVPWYVSLHIRIDTSIG